MSTVEDFSIVNKTHFVPTDPSTWLAALRHRVAVCECSAFQVNRLVSFSDQRELAGMALTAEDVLTLAPNVKTIALSRSSTLSKQLGVLSERVREIPNYDTPPNHEKDEHGVERMKIITYTHNQPMNQNWSSDLAVQKITDFSTVLQQLVRPAEILEFPDQLKLPNLYAHRAADRLVVLAPTVETIGEIPGGSRNLAYQVAKVTSQVWSELQVTKSYIKTIIARSNPTLEERIEEVVRRQPLTPGVKEEIRKIILEVRFEKHATTFLWRLINLSTIQAQYLQLVSAYLGRVLLVSSKELMTNAAIVEKFHEHTALIRVEDFLRDIKAVKSKPPVWASVEDGDDLSL